MTDSPVDTGADTGADTAVDKRRFSPSIARNRDVVRGCLQAILAGKSGHILEVGSGTGEHAAYCTKGLVNWHWHPTDATDLDFESIAGWAKSEGAETAARIYPPRLLDVLKPEWQQEIDQPVDVIFAANVIHITPPQLWPSLIKGSARLLLPGGILALYGPFRRHGAHTSPSNAEFDQWLAAKDPSFAVRDWEEMTAYSNPLGLIAAAPKPVPANNFFMHFVKR